MDTNDMRSFFIPGLLASCVMLAACGGASDPAATSAPAGQDSATTAAGADQAAPLPAADEWDRSSSPVEGTSLEIVSNPISFCNGVRQVAEVRWDVGAAGATSLQLWIEGASGNRKLWVSTKAQAGSKQTGPWVAEGTSFVALDPNGNRVINSTTVVAANCP